MMLLLTVDDDDDGDGDDDDDDDDNDPVGLFQKRGKWWELIVTIPPIYLWWWLGVQMAWF